MFNLLPIQLKKEIKLKKSYSAAKKIVCISWILLALPSGLLISSHILFKTMEKQLGSAPMDQNHEEIKKMSSDISKFNDNLKKSEDIQASHYNPSLLLAHFAEIIPEGIIISGINMSIEEKTISFSGEAQTRDQMLELQKKLSSDEYFKDFSYPISNLSEKNNIKFDLKGKIEL